MKLQWATRDGKRWEADFCLGLLTLRVDCDGKMGIYDGKDAVWESLVEVNGYDWQDLADFCESQLSDRLYRMSNDLDSSWVEAPPQSKCAMCSQYSADLHKGFYPGDHFRCQSCLKVFESRITAGNVTSFYWDERPFTYTIWQDPPAPLTQIADAIKAEAAGVKL